MAITRMHFTYNGGQPITIALAIDMSGKDRCAVAFGTSSDRNQMEGKKIDGLDQSPKEVINELRKALDSLECSFTPS
jgi:hypothetical protein